MLAKLGLQTTGANYKTIYAYVKKLALSTNHFKGQGHLKGTAHNWAPKQSFEEILIVNSLYTNTDRLKKRLIREKLLENKCSICEITTWQNAPIVLQLDHKNGKNTDHRIENLQLLCPNCHSQTPTFAGRNRKKQ